VKRMSGHVLVVAHANRPEAIAAEREALSALDAAGLVTIRDDEIADFTGDIDFAVVLGGDGTILRTAELVRGRQVPMLGVNLGHVGFLAESEREDITYSINMMAAGEYTVEERNTLAVTVLDESGNVVNTDWALNEAAVEKALPLHMVEVVIEIDGRPLSSFGCDGVVMATSTGSTAHAFSAGGPVVWPDVDAMILVPLAAHALFAKPLVVGPTQLMAVEVMASSRCSAVVVCDSLRQTPVRQGHRVEVRRHSEPVRLARLSSAPFTDRLVNKFSLPVVGWRGTARARAQAVKAADESTQSG